LDSGEEKVETWMRINTVSQQILSATLEPTLSLPALSFSLSFIMALVKSKSASLSQFSNSICLKHLAILLLIHFLLLAEYNNKTVAAKATEPNHNVSFTVEKLITKPKLLCCDCKCSTRKPDIRNVY
jgi:hypothetical protein